MNTPPPHGIKIVAIGGSVRPNNFTAKALALVVDEVQQNHPDIAIDTFDPTQLGLPLPGAPGSTLAQGDTVATLTALQDAVKAATGVVLATPEYHGSYSSVIKLVIDNLGFPSALSGKPVALLGVAAGQIGAIKALEHLRSVCSHVGAIVLPGPVSVAGVTQVFDDKGKCLDEAIEKRIRRTATNLIDYIHNHICPKAALEAMVRSEPS